MAAMAAMVRQLQLVYNPPVEASSNNLKAVLAIWTAELGMIIELDDGKIYTGKPYIAYIGW